MAFTLLLFMLLQRFFFFFSFSFLVLFSSLLFLSFFLFVGRGGKKKKNESPVSESSRLSSSIVLTSSTVSARWAVKTAADFSGSYEIDTCAATPPPQTFSDEQTWQNWPLRRELFCAGCGFRHFSSSTRWYSLWESVGNRSILTLKFINTIIQGICKVSCRKLRNL